MAAMFDVVFHPRNAPAWKGQATETVIAEDAPEAIVKALGNRRMLPADGVEWFVADVEMLGAETVPSAALTAGEAPRSVLADAAMLLRKSNPEIAEGLDLLIREWPRLREGVRG